ncbi:MAG: hypothetical protein KGI89_11700, partial [Euryarchaeota archaeon]|nr:hypothetical protein [Euryarchaeota archaeon]
RVPRDGRNRKTVEVAPAVYREIVTLVDRGYWLSFQEFAREALKEKLDRWKAAGHEMPARPADVVEEVRRDRERDRKPAPRA